MKKGRTAAWLGARGIVGWQGMVGEKSFRDEGFAREMNLLRRILKKTKCEEEVTREALRKADSGRALRLMFQDEPSTSRRMIEAERA